MNMIFITSFAFKVILGWEVFLSSLNDWSLSNDGWTLDDGSTYISDYTCPINQMKLLCLNGDTRSGYKTISGLPPHYQLRIVADLYYGGYYTNEYGELMLDSTLILHNSYYYSSMKVNINQCGSWPDYSNLEIQTAVGIINHSASAVHIYLISTVNIVNEVFCFRNVQLLINPCHYSCLTCNGSLENNCLSCYDSTTPVSGKCPTCSNPNISFQTPLAGCVQECTRTNYLADQNKFCQPNNRVTIDSTSFFWAIYVPPTTYDWDLYNNGVPQSQRYFDCNGYQLVGMYGKNEYITKAYAFSSTTKQIRIRVSHYMFNVWNQYSQVELLMDGVFVSLIYMKDGLFRSINSKVVQTSSGQCTNLAANKNYYFSRTESIITITNSNPTFTFKSSQDLWSVRDIHVDVIGCSLFCSTCLDEQNCSVCQASYHLYKGQCISTCPEYSTVSGVNCIDFDQETFCKLHFLFIDTSYLIKAFYSINSQDTETSLFNLFSSSGTNFQKGNSIYFSYLKDRRIFGGALVWLNAKFGNTYTIPQPHYAVRVRMVVVLGDDFGNGQFQYQLHTNSIVTLTRASTFTSHSQQWGDTYDEYFYQVNTLVSHTASSFSITVECIGDTSKAINQAFCGIENYFVTVLECQIFCDACTGISTCSSWSTTTANFDPITHQCFPGYSTDISSKTCVADPVCGNGVLELNEECDDGNSIPADGCFNCQYQCSSFYPNCIHIHPKSCNFGYYLNQYDNICYPICGDGIIVLEEQCEDGNILPFDGCHRCIFSCQDACQECRNGKCYKCKIGWSLQNGKCQPICGDGIVRGFEICDDANSYQIVDTCQSNICSYICPNNCQSCTLGVCHQCEGGFKLNTLVNKCETLCGDLNITEFEECDDGNLVPYDGCHQCMFQCQKSCSDCRFGKCYKCKSGWEWKSQTFRCEPICGDGLRVEIEVCDDRIYQLGDVCLACQFECPNNCIACDYGVCKVCDTGYQLDTSRNDCQPICGDQLIVSNEECDDGNLIPQDGCHECQYQCQDSCLECLLGKCYRCESGWEWKSQTFRCEPMCGDGLKAEIEVCDDRIYQLSDVCRACQFKCPNNCIACDYGVCKVCDTGYQLDETRNDCQPICGDNLVTLNEDCDDGNLIPDDGCHECQFSCQNGCEHCWKGQCFQCQKGWILNDVNFTCFTICGDGEVAGLEFCDDGNDVPLDGCYECNFQCQLQFLVCEQEKCQLTKDLVVASQNCSYFESCDKNIGIYIDLSANQCLSYCGDQIMALDEECDDGNLVPYDGCDKCLFSCDLLCTDCILGVCAKCQTGYQVLEQKCKGICGDGIQIVNEEECDDFNQIPRDGCTACKIDPNYECILTEMGPSLCYTCPKNCKVCDQFQCKQCQPSYFMSQGICLSCGDKCEECEGTPNNCISCVYEGCEICESKAGYYSNFEEKSCYSKCGDNVVSDGEQCDDGNNIPNDGCDDQCQLEKNFKCGDFSCVEIQPPAISVEYINSTTTNTLLYSIQASIIQGYCELIQLWIEEFTQNQFNFTIKENIQKNQCEFTFKFMKTIEETNLIHVIVPIIDFERRLLDQITREIIIKPRRLVYYSDSQKAQAQSVVAASQQLSLILKLIGPMTILLGGFNFFLTILDILTWINNFYFINVDYPENVRIFFQQLEWGDIFMIPSFITLNSKQDDYYFEAPTKFVEKEIDPLFVNNIQLFVILIGVSFLAYFLSRCVLSCLKKLYQEEQKSKNLAFYDLQNNTTINIKVKQVNQQKNPFLITKLKKECYYYQQNYRAILMQIIGLVFLDLCLATVLQLTNTSTSEYWIVKTNIIMAWLNLILIGYIFYLTYNVSNSHEILLKNKVYIRTFGSLYEEINIKSSISRSYIFLNLIRKCLFIFFTVYYYDDPILQTSTCCVACFLNIILLCYQNPFKSMQLLIKNGLPDIFIFLIILTTVGLAIDDQIKILSPDTKFTIGWIILSFIGISIMTQLIFLLQVFYENIKRRWKTIKKLICPDKSQ